LVWAWVVVYLASPDPTFVPANNGAPAGATRGATGQVHFDRLVRQKGWLKDESKLPNPTA
jgi:hypothetical protein